MNKLLISVGKAFHRKKDKSTVDSFYSLILIMKLFGLYFETSRSQFTDDTIEHGSKYEQLQRTYSVFVLIVLWTECLTVFAIADNFQDKLIWELLFVILAATCAVYCTSTFFVLQMWVF